MTLPLVRSPPYRFSASAAQGAKWGKSQGCSWPRLPLTRERAVGPGGAPGPSCPCWGRTACGKVPADLQALQWTLQAPLRQGVQLCPWLPSGLPLGPPQCFPWSCSGAQPAAGSASVEFSLFFNVWVITVQTLHWPKRSFAIWQFGCRTWYFAFVILALTGSQCKDR